MIGHEDVGLDGDAIASAIAFEAVQIGGIILLIMENSRTAVAADDHMIEGAGEVDTWFTGHWGWILRPSPLSNQYSGLTPFHPTDPIPSDENQHNQSPLQHRLSFERLGGLFDIALR